MDNAEGVNNKMDTPKGIAHTAEVLESNITVKTLLESLAEGVVIVNDKGQIILINNRLEELTRYSRKEIMGKSLNVLIPDTMHEKHTQFIDQFFKSPKVRPMGIGFDLSARRKDNSQFPIEISLSFLRIESGMVGIGIITDITYRKEIENELKRKNIELDQYAHTIAHDLHSSIHGMVGLSELLLEQGDHFTKDEYDNGLREIVNTGRKMNQVIQELLMFATLNKSDIEKRSINIPEIVDAACKRLSYQIEEKSVSLNISNELFTSKGYAPWVEEVFYNFISNAIKYGGNPPIIDISSQKSSDGFIKYNIKDNGKGMPEELKDVIFNDNDNTKDKFVKGHGLGIKIVKRIIERLDGKLSVETEAGKGSIFSFYLKE